MKVKSGNSRANTEHLYNICTKLDKGRRHWADVVLMLNKCFVFTEVGHLEFDQDEISTVYPHLKQHILFNCNGLAI